MNKKGRTSNHFYILSIFFIAFLFLANITESVAQKKRVKVKTQTQENVGAEDQHFEVKAKKLGKKSKARKTIEGRSFTNRKEVKRSRRLNKKGPNYNRRKGDDTRKYEKRIAKNYQEVKKGQKGNKKTRKRTIRSNRRQSRQ